MHFCMKRRWFSPRYHSDSSKKTPLNRVPAGYPFPVTGEPVSAYRSISAEPLRSEFELFHPAMLPAAMTLCGESSSLLFFVYAYFDFLRHHFTTIMCNSQEKVKKQKSLGRILYTISNGNSVLQISQSLRDEKRYPFYWFYDILTPSTWSFTVV